LRSIVSIGTGVLFDAILPLVRTIVLARVLPQDQFGIAVTALATVTIVEMCSDVGVMQSAVRGSATVPPDRFMGTLHSISLLRAAVTLVLITIILAVQQATLDSSFGLDLFILAGAALMLRGFENLSIKRLTREYNFWREAVLMSGAQIVWTVVAIIAALVTQSYAALFYGMLASAIWFVVASNVLAPERLRLCWSKDAANEALRFGAPLIPNGLASATASTDRLIVGNFLGTRQVAVYSVAISLATLPRSILWRFSTSILVPHFANLVSDPTKERKFYNGWLLFVAAMASAYSIFLINFGPWIIGLAFGALYVPSNVLMSLIAINVFIKFMMLVPIPAAYARGQTSTVFLGSLVSAIATVPAGLTLLFGMKNLEIFMLALNTFEAIGLLWYLHRTSRLHGLRLPIALTAAIAPMLALAAATATVWAGH
jgi:PST family polysaccharide transporter